MFPHWEWILPAAGHYTGVKCSMGPHHCQKCSALHSDLKSLNLIGHVYGVHKRKICDELPWG